MYCSDFVQLQELIPPAFKSCGEVAIFPDALGLAEAQHSSLFVNRFVDHISTISLERAFQKTRKIAVVLIFSVIHYFEVNLARSSHTTNKLGTPPILRYLNAPCRI